MIFSCMFSCASFDVIVFQKKIPKYLVCPPECEQLLSNSLTFQQFSDQQQQNKKQQQQVDVLIVFVFFKIDNNK